MAQTQTADADEPPADDETAERRSMWKSRRPRRPVTPPPHCIREVFELHTVNVVIYLRIMTIGLKFVKCIVD